ncbi:hypothetical protein RLIN73S_00141 [Rhodanobacter lindaniclasticus]
MVAWRLVEALVEHVQAIQRGRVHRHPRQGLPPGLATQAHRRGVVFAGDPSQQLMHAAEQGGAVAVLAMALDESIQLAEDAPFPLSRAVSPPPEPRETRERQQREHAKQPPTRRGWPP